MPKKQVIKRKKCKKHGETDYVLEGRGYYRCKKCRSEGVMRYRRNIRKKLLKEFGGECKLCGYKKCDDALHFHHLDPQDKSFGLAQNGITRSYKAMKKEAQKCILICANCHAELHSQEENTEPSPKGKV